MLNVSTWPGDWNLLQRLWQDVGTWSCPDDEAAVRQARNEACYAEPGTPTNPLIEWTLSDEWISVPEDWEGHEARKVRRQIAVAGEVDAS